MNYEFNQGSGEHDLRRNDILWLPLPVSKIRPIFLNCIPLYVFKDTPLEQGVGYDADLIMAALKTCDDITVATKTEQIVTLRELLGVALGRAATKNAPPSDNPAEINNGLKDDIVGLFESDTSLAPYAKHLEGLSVNPERNFNPLWIEDNVDLGDASITVYRPNPNPAI